MLRGHPLSPLAAAVIGICVTLFAATYTAYASHVAAEGGWPPPVDLSQSGGSDSKGPHLAMAQNGDLHVIWMQPGGVTDTVYHASSDDQGSNWSYSLPLTPSGNHRYAATADADEYGLVHVVWFEAPYEFELWYARLSGDGWQDQARITNTIYPTRTIVAPDVVSTHEFVYAVWSEMNVGAADSQLDVLYSWSEGGGAWSPATTTVETRDTSKNARVAADAAGNVHLVWEEHTTPQHIYYVSRTVETAKTVWSTPITVSEGLAQTATTPDIVVGSDDTVHVVFGVDVEGQKELQDIYYAHFPVNQPGVVSATLIPGSRVEVSHKLPTFTNPVVALSGTDQVHVAWNGWKAGDHQDANRIYYAVSEDGGITWSDPVPVSPRDTEPDGFASLAVDDKFVHLVWQEKVSGSDEDIYYTRRFPVRIPLPLALKAF